LEGKLAEIAGKVTQLKDENSSLVSKVEEVSQACSAKDQTIKQTVDSFNKLLRE